MDKQELLGALAPDIAKIDAVMKVDVSAIESPLLREIMAYALFNGGKRIRPILAVLAGRLCQIQNLARAVRFDEEDAFRLAITFEYLHAASLLHDDVIDGSDKRRGRPAANVVWGSAAVILAGDYLHARAMELAGEIGGVQCLASLSRAVTSMVEAEFLQAANVKEKKISRMSYFQVLEGKTAALIGAACEVGALFSQGTVSQVGQLRIFGEHLGLAFQVVDDSLDYWGDPGATGKMVGLDFIEGKVTLPLIHALERSSVDERDRLNALLAESPDERRVALPMVRDRIEKLGGLEYAKQKAKEFANIALEQLTEFSDCEARRLLEGLADYVLTRNK